MNTLLFSYYFLSLTEGKKEQKDSNSFVIFVSFCGKIYYLFHECTLSLMLFFIFNRRQERTERFQNPSLSLFPSVGNILFILSILNIHVNQDLCGRDAHGPLIMDFGLFVGI